MNARRLWVAVLIGMSLLIVRSATAYDSKSAAEAVKRGDSLRENDEFDAIISAATDSIRRNPKNGVAYYARARAYEEEGEFSKAFADYTETIRLLDPKSANAHWRRGCLYEKKGNHDKAIADYTEAIRLDPKNATIYYGRAHAYRQKGELNKAITDYTEAIRLNPEEAEA